jgi:biopolymer transport protein ExbB/TolQ
MTLWDAFQAGGWGMWFILIFGILAVFAAARFTFRGELHLEIVSRWMILTTLLSSALGFFTGMIAVASSIGEHAKNNDDRLAFLVQGMGEALNNLSLGLILATLACLFMAVGHRRFPSQS